MDARDRAFSVDEHGRWHGRSSVEHRDLASLIEQHGVEPVLRRLRRDGARLAGADHDDTRAVKTVDVAKNEVAGAATGIAEEQDGLAPRGEQGLEARRSAIEVGQYERRRLRTDLERRSRGKSRLELLDPPQRAAMAPQQLEAEPRLPRDERSDAARGELDPPRPGSR